MNDPLEQLTNKDDRQPSWLNDKWNPMICTLMGTASSLYLNYGTRKPLMSGVQRHVAFGAIGLALGIYFENMLREHSAKRDAVLRHYVELHPDDFPAKPRTKYADVLEHWVPIR